MDYFNPVQLFIKVNMVNVRADDEEPLRGSSILLTPTVEAVCDVERLNSGGVSRSARDRCRCLWPEQMAAPPRLRSSS